jgi:hypothetical protein
MQLSSRLQQLELKIKLNSKQPGCDISLFIVIPEASRNAPFDTDTYRPTEAEIEKYLKSLKDSGQCRDCKGSCAIDWSPDGFKNHTIMGESSSSSPTPKISRMYCANAETPELLRQLHSGGREPITPRINTIQVVDSETAELTRRVLNGERTG